MFKIMSSREYNGLVSRIDAARKEIETRVLADAEKIKDLQLKVHETKMALDTCKTRKADIQKDADQYQAALRKANEEIATQLQELKNLKSTLQATEADFEECRRVRKSLREDRPKHLEEIKLLKARIDELESRKAPEMDKSILVKTKTRIEGALKDLKNVSRGRKSPTNTKVQTILSQTIAELAEALK